MTNDDRAPEAFDLIIVGTGSGNSIPEYLDDHRVALVERGVFGGTCINRGCIPSKMFVLPADVAETARHAGRLGLDITVNGADWPAIRDRVFGRIDPIADSGHEYRATGTPNVTLLSGTARFVDTHVLDVDGRRITAPQILLAAGSRPSIPAIDGLVETGFRTSDSIMRLERLPERLGIIGGGYIAAEMGHVFAALGSEVSLFNRSDGLLRDHDGEVAAHFTELFARRVDLHLAHLPTSISRTDDGRIAIEHHADRVVVDELLVATGREPNSDLLDVDAAGIECEHHGRVVVDDTMATNVAGIWAIGDLVNEFQLKHVANAEAKIAFWNVAHPDDLRRIDNRFVPAAVFSDPQVAAVGLTSEQAEEQGVPVLVGRRGYGDTAYGWALEDDTSFAKVLVHAENDLIVGAHVIGPQASTLIQPLVQAMQFGQTATDLARRVYYIHPALTEVIENTLLAAIEQR